MRLTVARRMALVTAAALLGVALMTVASRYMTDKVYGKANFANLNAVPSMVVLGELRRNYVLARVVLYQHLLANEEAEKLRLEGLLEGYKDGLKSSFLHYETDGCLGISCIADSRDKDYLTQEKTLWYAFEPQLGTLLSESRKGAAGAATARQMLMHTFDEAKFFDLMAQHFSYNAELARQSADSAVEIKSQVGVLMLGLGGLMLAGIAMLGFINARTLLRQLGGEPEEAAAIASQIAVGDLTSNIVLRDGDDASLMARIKVLIANMERVAKRAAGVSKGNLDAAVEVLSPQDRLGQAIRNMLQALRTARESDQRTNWLSEGKRQLSAALTGDFSPADVADAAIGVLGRHLGAGRGVVYVLRENEPVLDLLGSYMYTERAQTGSSFKFGEGAIGQAAREKKPITLTSIAADAAPIVTGTSCLPPRYTYTYPLLRDGILLGVFELSSGEKYDQVQLEFLGGAGEVISSFLYIAEQRGQIRQLLTSAEQAERDVRNQNLQLQEINSRMEEQQQQLQQQAEELQQSNAQMEEQQQQMQQQSEELQQTNAQMEEQQQLLERSNDELRRSRSDIDDKATQLEQSNRYKSEFLANMSHELRTPLNAIILLSQMMADNHDGHLDENDVKRASVIHRSGEDLLHLINDVLDLSKVEAGRMDLNCKAIDPGLVVLELEDLFGSSAQARGIELITDNRMTDAFISDPDKLDHILRNLLSNAIKFTAAGSVTLRIEHAGAPLPVRFVVRDTGIGIPLPQQQTIFEAFRQVDGSSSREYGGTGLGLTISLRFAELLGGTIELQSEAGQGSTFTLCLPDAPSATARPPAPATAPPTTATAGAPHAPAPA